MKTASLIIAFIVVLLIGCKPEHTQPSLQTRLQGVWARHCGCTTDLYKFSGDSIYLSSSGHAYVNAGYVVADTGYFLCFVCMPPENEYLKYSLQLSSNQQQLFIGTGYNALCNDSSCTDVAYYKVQ